VYKTRLLLYKITTGPALKVQGETRSMSCLPACEIEISVIVSAEQKKGTTWKKEPDRSNMMCRQWEQVTMNCSHQIK